MSTNKGDDDTVIIVVVIIILLVSISLSVLAGMFMDWSWLTGSKNSPSPSPIHCEVEFLDTLEWEPCDEDNCGDAKGSDYAMYHYRTGTVKQAAKHGGRECPDLREYRIVQVDSASPSAPASSPPASSSPASSSPSNGSPSPSAPASSTPASSAPASSPPASSPPASSPASSSPSAKPFNIKVYHRYQDVVKYPVHNNSDDNYYNYCKHGQSMGWCEGDTFINGECKDECTDEVRIN